MTDNLETEGGAEPTRALNPYEADGSPAVNNGTALAITQTREIAEVQAQVVMARRFPRDPRMSVERILTDCTRPTLAGAALYAYPRGGEIVSGPSIRLAESIARAWGNLAFGVRELSQRNGVSTVEAFAWDLETNTRASKLFQVVHQLKAYGRIKSLDDPRDIYELTANLGARRMRACILAIVPGDVVESAVRQCELTQANSGGAPAEQVAAMIEKFAALGITRDMIAKRLGHKPETCKGAEVLNLRRIYLSIADGIGKASDFFDTEERGSDPGSAAAALSEAIRNRSTSTPAADSPTAEASAQAEAGSAEGSA
jgi:hypothetical protein